MKCTGKTTQKNVQLDTCYYEKEDLIKMFEDVSNDMIFSRMENIGGIASDTKQSKCYSAKDIAMDKEMVENLFYYFDEDEDYLGITLHKGDDLKVVLDEFGYYHTVLERDGKQFYVEVI